MHIAEPLVPEPSFFKVEIALEELKRYKSPHIDQILEELIKQEVIQCVLRSTNLLTLRGLFEKFIDWWQCAAVMQREEVTVTLSCSGGGNIVVV
jgi:hypothetical protein